jgi:hypothetical protein
MTEVTQLAWTDLPLEVLPLPSRPLAMTLGLGSGLTRRHMDPPGVVWALTDRGPNLHLSTAIDDYGLSHLAPLRDRKDAKVLPLPGFAPELVKLELVDDSIRLLERAPLSMSSGARLSGRAPMRALADEPLFGLDGTAVEADALGVDPEGLAPAHDGGFWIGEEYGPTLLKVDAHGVVQARWTPQDTLPTFAARRRPNRGFEAVAAPVDRAVVYLALQSSIDARSSTPFVRIWTLDAAAGQHLSTHLYLFDPPETFARDRERGAAKASNLKICDAAALGDGRLLVLERIAHSTKLYVVHLSPDRALPEHFNEHGAALIEDIAVADWPALGIAALTKRLVFSSDDHRQVGPDVEGLAVLSSDTLLLVSDNDFGVEGATTGFWRIRLDAPV